MKRRAWMHAASAWSLELFATLNTTPAWASDEVQPRQWPKGKPTPDFQLQDTQAQTWRLSDLKGRATLINFWASWCEPCRSEMPSLELAAQQFETQGVVVLAVNFRETDATVQRYLQTYPTSLSILRDRDGAVARAWGVRLFPTTALIDKHGHARALVHGEVDWTSPQAKAWIHALL